MIIYIHGFGSSGFGEKASLFKEYFEDEIMTPSLSYVPSLSVDTLEQIISILQQKGEKVNLVGSSLGGYYAIYLANKYNLKAVLINPAVSAYNSLDRLGMTQNYYDGSSFEVIKEHLNFLKSIEVENLTNQDRFLTLLQTDDEVLNYEEAALKLENSELIIEEGGNHSFENIESYFRKIYSFLD